MLRECFEAEERSFIATRPEDRDAAECANDRGLWQDGEEGGGEEGGESATERKEDEDMTEKARNYKRI